MAQYCYQLRLTSVADGFIVQIIGIVVDSRNALWRSWCAEQLNQHFGNLHTTSNFTWNCGPDPIPITLGSEHSTVKKWLELKSNRNKSQINLLSNCMFSAIPKKMRSKQNRIQWASQVGFRRHMAIGTTWWSWWFKWCSPEFIGEHGSHYVQIDGIYIHLSLPLATCWACLHHKCQYRWLFKR